MNDTFSIYSSVIDTSEKTSEVEVVLKPILRYMSSQKECSNVAIVMEQGDYLANGSFTSVKATSSPYRYEK